MKGEKVWKLVRMVLFCTLFYGITISTAAVNAQEVQSVETESSVLFTGVYEPIGQPDKNLRRNLTWITARTGCIVCAIYQTSIKIYDG